ncbi:MAG: FtsX-like permease family protein, partial [Fulvivirga sp.]
QFYEDGSIQYADSNYFEMFTHEVIEGNLKTALEQPNAIVLTSNAAQKYFGLETQAVGKTLNVSGSWWTNGEHMVTAVIKDPPMTSHFRFDFLISMESLLQSEAYRSSNGTSTEGNFVTYIELNQNVDIKALEDKLPLFIDNYQGDELKNINGKADLYLQPLTDIHLTPGYDHEMSPTIKAGTLYSFIGISVLVIVLAWINYVSLSTARATERRREVGIKKSIGVTRHQLIAQFLTESLILHLIGCIIAVAFAYVMLPYVSAIINRALIIDFSSLNFWLACSVFICFGSFIAAIYPAFVISSFKPITIIKGDNTSQASGFSLRQALVVLQFSISILLISGTLIVTRQLNFMQGENKGFDSEKVLVIKGPGALDGTDTQNDMIALKSQLMNL